MTNFHLDDTDFDGNIFLEQAFANFSEQNLSLGFADPRKNLQNLPNEGWDFSGSGKSRPQGQRNLVRNPWKLENKPPLKNPLGNTDPNGFKSQANILRNQLFKDKSKFSYLTLRDKDSGL